MTVWTPAQLIGTPVCFSWLDLSDASNYTLSGTSFASATDKFGLGHNMRTTSNRYPGKTTINGLTAMRAYSNNNLCPYITGAYTSNYFGLVALFLDSGAAGAYARLISAGAAATDASSAAQFEIDVGTASGGTLRLVQNGDTQSGADVKAQPTIVTATMSATAQTLGINGTSSPATLVPAVAPAFSWSQLTFLGCNTGAMTSNTTIGEIVMFSAPPSAADLQRVEGYLAWKWGTQATLAADHPYKAAAPTSGTTYTASSTLAGAGAASLSGQAQTLGQLLLSGASRLLAYSHPTDGGLAMLSGLAGASFAGSRIQTGASALEGDGLVSPKGTASLHGMAHVFGSSAFGAAATQIWRTVSDLAGVGALQARASKVLRDQAALAGAGAIQAAGRHVWTGHATFAGSGASSLRGALLERSPAHLTGSGTFSPGSPRVTHGSRVVLQGDGTGVWAPNAIWRDSGAVLGGVSRLVASLTNTVKSRKKPSRARLTTPTGAPSWAGQLVNQINALLASTPTPTSPTAIYDVATASDLPAASDHPHCLAWIMSAEAVVISNGASWLHLNLGTAI